MVPDDSGDDKSSVAVVSNTAPQSAFPTREAFPKLQVTPFTTSDSTHTIAAPAPSPQEQKEEQQPRQQSQLRDEPPQQHHEPQPQHHEPQPQPPPQQNGDSRVSETNTTTPESESDMASHRPPAAALHGLHAGYPTSSSSPIYPQTSLPTTQYASYSTITAAAQQGDVYRVSPVGTPQMSLPSMRTIDAMSQQSVPPISHHSMSMGMSMPLTAVSATPPYFTSHSTPIPSNYGFPQDALARYPLPHDPRLINHRGPKKVCFIFTKIESSRGPIGLGESN